ncbi:NosD domain-containing protein [Bacillus spongiae]|uniref:NosD domain-containing protein n=1 Tax=Bacillus spongiae TaxID=2683610 RepID=A0ABU8HBL1_9BACI
MAIHVVPTDFLTVQDAINFASPGDSIQLLDGTFDGFVVPNNKPRLKIFGEGIGESIIAGAPLGSFGIIVLADRTSIQGLTVQGFALGGVQINSDSNILKDIESVLNMGINTEGFELNGQNNLCIRCTSRQNDFGMTINSGEHNFIYQCIMQNNEFGFFSVSNNNKLISSEIKENNSFGIILLAFTTLFGSSSLRNGAIGIFVIFNNNTIIENIVWDNDTGIQLFFFGENVIDSNIVRKNDINGGIFVSAITMDNVIRFNKLKLNEPFDLISANINNIFDGNRCESSNPPGLCI